MGHYPLHYPLVVEDGVLPVSPEEFLSEFDSKQVFTHLHQRWDANTAWIKRLWLLVVAGKAYIDTYVICKQLQTSWSITSCCRCSTNGLNFLSAGCSGATGRNCLVVGKGRVVMVMMAMMAMMAALGQLVGTAWWLTEGEGGWWRCRWWWRKGVGGGSTVVQEATVAKIWGRWVGYFF